MKMKEIGPGGASLAPPLDPPLLLIMTEVCSLFDELDNIKDDDLVNK